MAESRCDGCGAVIPNGLLTLPIPRLEQRIDPGGVVPSGECPDCGSLCYPAKPEDYDEAAAGGEEE